MPTVYTEGVATGKITDFKEYAMLCARAFGACIMLRDEPLSSDIPEFEPSNYHDEQIAKAKADLLEFASASVEQRKQMHADEHAKNVKAADEELTRNREQLSRYESMLAKAKAFKPPSTEHQEYANFIVSQLEESIRFDCNGSYYEELKEQVPFEKWEVQKLSELQRSIAYHSEQRENEIARTVERNRWVKQLREAVLAI